jgi:hypothetical protein
LPVLGGFACKVYLQRLSKILLLAALFLLPPSSRHLGIPYIDVFYQFWIILSYELFKLTCILLSSFTSLGVPIIQTLDLFMVYSVS